MHVAKNYGVGHLYDLISSFRYSTRRRNASLSSLCLRFSVSYTEHTSSMCAIAFSSKYDRRNSLTVLEKSIMISNLSEKFSLSSILSSSTSSPNHSNILKAALALEVLSIAATRSVQPTPVLHPKHQKVLVSG